MSLPTPSFTAGAEDAEEDFSSVPIGRRRLAQKPLPFWIKIDSLTAVVPILSLVLRNRKLFIWRYLPAK
jgi:hypothetical protein